jgi:two-component system, NtrC family, sensor histidine kinase KinB
MKIKTKLFLAIGLLFVLIIFLALVGTLNINRLKLETENILIANYNTLEYGRNMLKALDELDADALAHLGEYLGKQEENVTEVGESEITRQLRTDLNRLIASGDSTVIRSMRNNIYLIMDMNMQAIQRKTELATSTANNATRWIAFSGTLSFIIAFVLLINLPSNIADPIKELTESIKEIANENYKERVHFETHDEFGELAQSFNTMAEKLEEYNSSSLARLMNEKKRIETLINNMHDPVIGLDEDMKIIFANDQAVRITGTSLDEMIGKDAKNLALRNDLIRSLIRDLQNGDLIEEKKPEPLKIYLHDKEGYFDKEVLHIEIVPAGEQDKKLIGHVIILNNVTEYRELDFAKTNFIATVSHEFKTPISSIKMSVQLLENEQIGALNTEQKNLLENIKDDAVRLLKITTELLNMTQVESGNIQLSLLPVDPKEIVLKAVEATKVQAEQKHITLEVQSMTTLPKINADLDKTVWVLINLISNAIRYSHENSMVHIGIDTRDHQVVFSVKDQGQGINPQYKDKIFDRYFRVPGTKKEGTGLGLAISKEFIEAQGGKIHVDSEFGAGSKFSISLNALT